MSRTPTECNFVGGTAGIPNPPLDAPAEKVDGNCSANRSTRPWQLTCQQSGLLMEWINHYDFKRCRYLDCDVICLVDLCVGVRLRPQPQHAVDTSVVAHYSKNFRLRVNEMSKVSHLYLREREVSAAIL